MTRLPSLQRHTAFRILDEGGESDGDGFHFFRHYLAFFVRI